MNKNNTDLTDSQSIISHPNLPLFAIANRGFIELLSFSNSSRITEFQTNNKEVVNTMKFNNFGDKLGAVDSAGNFLLWKLNK